MNKFLDNFGDDLYKKIGFKKSLFVVLSILLIPPVISILFNFQLDKEIEKHKSFLDEKLIQFQNIINKDFELFVYKKNIYSEAIKLLDKKYDSMKWSDAKPVSEPPTDEEINNVYRQLLLVSDKDEILRMYWKFMDLSMNDFCSPVNRGIFINLLRIDLGKEKIGLPIDSIPYFNEHSIK